MKKVIIPMICILMAFSSCKEALDVYLGVPLQPRFDSSAFIPGLNIFGVLRPDFTHNYNNSFIIVQKVVPAVGDSLGWEIDSALVWVSKEISPSDSTCEFLQNNYNGTFSETNYRPDCNFSPVPGEIYRVECIYEDLPVLYAYTIIPNQPKIAGSIKYDNGTLGMEFITDSSYYMLDVYAYSNGQVIGFQRLPFIEELNTQVTLSPIHQKPDSVIAFSYDYNLAVYYLTSNTSLNFNKYRKSFSTVENGYGVFGAINKAQFVPE